MEKEDFLNSALRWIYTSHLKRAHFGRYRNGNRAYQKSKSLLTNTKGDILIFP